MLFTQRATIVAITSAAILSMSLGLTLPAAHAAETTSATTGAASAPAGVVLVVDATPAPAPVPVAPVARVIGIDANVVNGLSVTAPKGSNVKITTKGAKSFTKKVNSKGAPIVFKRLVPGKKYSVVVNGTTVGTGTPVNAPGAAYNLTITSTGSATSALVTWKYQSAPKAGTIGYDVTAIPVAGQLPTARSLEMKRSITSETTEAVVGNLDPDVLYTFTVTPKNTAAHGKASSATLPITLGAAAGQLSAAEKAQAVETARVSAQLAAEAAARAAANSRPAVTPAGPVTPTGPAAPTTKTIYVCPAGFSERGALCEKTTPYTYRTVTVTTPYTFHSEGRIEACAGGDCPGSEYRNMGTDWSGTLCPNGGTMHGGQCLGWTTSQRSITVSVKDAMPAGLNDNGSTWFRNEQVKDGAPAGYTDNGSTWIATAAKEAKVVPA